MRRSILGGIVAIAAALVLPVISGGVDASAAKITTAYLTVNSAKKTLTVGKDANTDSVFYYRFGKSKVVKNKHVLAMDKAWTTMDNTAGADVISLSSMNSAVDNFIQIKGDKTTDEFTIKIPAAKSKVAAVANYEGDSPVVTLNDITDKKNPVAISGVEYRDATSAWATYSISVDFTSYLDKGGVLYFRPLAGNELLVSKATKNISIYYEDADSEKNLTVYTVNPFAGKEAKLSIVKRAKGPAIAYDLAKIRVKMARGTEMRQVSDSTAAGVAWIDGQASKAWIGYENGMDTTYSTASTNLTNAQNEYDEIMGSAEATAAAKKEAKSNLAAAKKAYNAAYAAYYPAVMWFDLQKVNAAYGYKTAVTTEGGFEARLAATEKKPASFISRLDYNKGQVAPSAKNGKNATSETIDLAKVTVDTGLTFEDASVTNNKGVVTNKIKITNTTTNAYQIVVAAKDTYSGSNLPDADTVANKTAGTYLYNVKAQTTNKSGVDVPGTLTITMTEGQEVYIRKPAITKGETAFASAYAVVGKYVAPTE